MPIIFTPHSATASLPRLRPLVERVQETHARLERCPPPSRLGDQPVSSRRFVLLVRHWNLLGSLRRQGVELDDGRAGRIRFPARRSGRPVWLCWTLGEGGVQCWRSDEEAGILHRVGDRDGEPEWSEGD